MRVSQVTDGVAFFALSLASELFGPRPLVVKGTNEFCRQVAVLPGRRSLPSPSPIRSSRRTGSLQGSNTRGRTLTVMTMTMTTVSTFERHKACVDQPVSCGSGSRTGRGIWARVLMLDEFPSRSRLHLIEDAQPKCAG